MVSWDWAPLRVVGCWQSPDYRSMSYNFGRFNCAWINGPIESGGSQYGILLWAECLVVALSAVHIPIVENWQACYLRHWRWTKGSDPFTRMYFIRFVSGEAPLRWICWRPDSTERYQRLWHGHGFLWQMPQLFCWPSGAGIG